MYDYNKWKEKIFNPEYGLLFVQMILAINAKFSVNKALLGDEVALPTPLLSHTPEYARRAIVDFLIECGYMLRLDTWASSFETQMYQKNLDF